MRSNLTKYYLVVVPVSESIASHSLNMFDPMTRPTLPAYQRQSSLQPQQLFSQGQLQVNKPVMPSATSEHGVEAINSNREVGYTQSDESVNEWIIGLKK